LGATLSPRKTKHTQIGESALCCPQRFLLLFGAKKQLFFWLQKDIYYKSHKIIFLLKEKPLSHIHDSGINEQS